MAKKETITQSLGLPDEFADESFEILNRLRNAHNGIADLLIASAEEVRESTLGKIDSPLTEYEKKLLMIGFFLGNHIGKQRSNPLAAIFSEIIRSAEKDEQDDGKES
jgi:hypothetical protein